MIYWAVSWAGICTDQSQLQPNLGNHAEQTYSLEPSRIWTAPLTLYLAPNGIWFEDSSFRKKKKKKAGGAGAGKPIKSFPKRSLIKYRWLQFIFANAPCPWTVVLYPGWLTVISNTPLHKAVSSSAASLSGSYGPFQRSMVRALAGVHENRQRKRSIKTLHMLSCSLLMNLMVCLLVETMFG